MQNLIPFVIIITFPIIIALIYQLIKRNRKLLFIFDDQLLKSPIKLSTVLLAVALFFILYSYLVHLIFGISDPSDYIWNLVGLLVSASHFVKTKGADTNYIILYLFTMLIGLFVYGIFISNLVGFVKEKLKKLSKGRTNVIEKKHLLITGKSEYLYPIIDQYIDATIKIKLKKLKNIANRDIIAKQKIVLLNEDNPEKVMNEVEKRTINLMNQNYTEEEKKLYLKEIQSKLIYRSGNPHSIYDLNMCNIVNAQSVIVLGTDQQKIKTILAISATDFKSNEESFVISKFNDRELLDVAERSDLSDEYDLIDINRLIANLTTQTTIQPNLSYVYDDLLNHNKTSIEFMKISDDAMLGHLVGKTFTYASRVLSNALLLGLKNEKIIINPNADGETIIKESDSLIILRDPEETISFILDYKKNLVEGVINDKVYPFIKEDKNLVIIGCSKNLRKVLEEFNHIVSENSQVTVLFSNKHKSKINVDKLFNGLNIDYKSNFKFYKNFDEFKTFINEIDLDNLIDSVIVSPNDFLSKKDRDDESIFTLLDLKHLEKTNNRDYNITVDLAELSNFNIIEHMNIADVIISDKFSSELIFQFATHRDMKHVYYELFSNYGDEIYSIPLSNYITNFDKEINFHTLSESALLKNEIAIGLKTDGKPQIITDCKFKNMKLKPTDHLIVISKGH